jgi:hypothetical protein
MKEIISFDVYIDEEEMTGVDKISLVKRPAILENFIYMGDEQPEQYKQISLSDDKQIVVGPALIPDLEIVRKDEDGEPYFIKYSKEQIEKIAQKFFKFKTAKSVNKDHKENQAEDTYIYESWIVGENDKAKSLGFDVPVGTWMVSMKVDNTELWEQIKSGKYKGFSIEGLFKFKRSSRVVKQCGCGIGVDIDLESYTDYPEGAQNNAKRALEWAEKNGWGECGTAVGKARANQLANGEPISEETIARMSSFRRQQQNKDVPYSEGCGGLMWDAWGGDAGINWAENKLKEIRQTKIEMAGEPGLIHPNCRCSIRRNEFRLSKPRLGKNGQPVPCEICREAKVSWESNGFVEDVFGTRYDRREQSEITLGYNGEDVEYEIENNDLNYNIDMSEQVSLVKPGQSETQDEFVSRCMGDNKMNTEYPDQAQRAAVCYAYWDEKQEKININMVSAILKDGNTLHTDAESMAVGVEVYFMDGETKVAVDNGEYELEDGNIVVVEDSKIKEIKDMNEEPIDQGGNYKDKEKEDMGSDKEKTSMEIDPMLMEQFDALKGMIENLNLKIDALMGAESEDMKSVKQSLETLETKVEKIAVEGEMKSVETIDDIKKVAQAVVRKKIDYDLIARYNKKF